MVTWTTVLIVVCLLANLGEDFAIQLERLRRLWIAPALGIPLAIFIYVTVWLSPRSIDSGPNGIVVSKADHMALIPWQAIESYTFTRMFGHNALQISDTCGGSHLLYLADKVHPKQIERELVKITGKHPNNSFKRTAAPIFE